MIRQFASFCGILAAFYAADAAAHCPVLSTAAPKQGGRVAGSPPALVLHFTGPVVAERSVLDVRDEFGHKVNMIGHPEAVDSHTLSSQIEPLIPGEYKARWNVWGECGEFVPGTFKFTVTPAATIMQAPAKSAPAKAAPAPKKAAKKKSAHKPAPKKEAQ